MNKEEIQKIQLAIHDLINQEKYDEALPLIYTVLEEYPNEAATLNFLGYIFFIGMIRILSYFIPSKPNKSIF